ncbi:MAG: carboxypeptidase-like regulatory domain-containing protein [Acidobacteriaceae bacterium]
MGPLPALYAIVKKHWHKNEFNRYFALEKIIGRYFQWGSGDMKIRSILRSVAVLFLTTTSTVLAQKSNGSVSGTVFCADTGRPAHFAVVRLYKAQATVLGEGTSARSTADLNGRFTLTSVSPGDYYVDVTMIGYFHPLEQLMRARALGLSEQDEASLRDMLTPVDVVAGQTSSVKVTAYRGAAISGDAEYDDGTPAAEIVISAWEVGVGGKFINAGLTATTDDRGNYRFAGLGGGKFTLEAHAPEMPDMKEPHVYLGNVYNPTAAETIMVKRGEEITGMDFVLPTTRPQS